MDDLAKVGEELARLRADIPDERWQSDEPLARYCRAVEPILTVLLERTVKLEKEVAELKERLGENSQNSSKPPSSDPPGTLRKPDRGPSGRQQGGQKGHRGHHRAMLPTSKVDEVVAVKAACCSCCSGSLVEGRTVSVSRHQVAEIPPIKARVTEYQLHTTECPNCKSTTKAPLPAGVPKGRFGPALIALVAILVGRFKMSCRNIQEFLSLIGLRIGLGSVPRLQSEASASLQAPWIEIKNSAPKAKVLNADDTAWRLKRAYLSVVCLVAPAWTLYQIVVKRDHKTLKEIFKGFTGILGSDRASTYSFHKGLKQACLAHVDRLFQRFVDRGEKSREVGKLCQGEMDRLWASWHELCAQKIDKAGFRQKIWPIRARLARHLQQGEGCGHSRTQRSCSRLLRKFKELWTFVSNPEIEPTNNAAERALRMLVMLRRVCFGSKTEKGLRFVERILTVVETCRKRNHNAWQFVTSCIQARLSGHPAPLLLAE